MIISEDSRRSPKSSEDVWSLPKAKLSSYPSPSVRTRINPSSLPVLFTSKIRDRKEDIVIYSFYTWFLFLTWVWVNIFLEIVSSKTATTHIFQSGMRNWPASVSRREIKVFNPQAWELAGIQNNHFFFGNYYINPHKLLHFDIVRLKIDVTPLLSGLLLSRHPLISSSIFIKWLLMFIPQQLPPFNGDMTILLFTV